MNLLLLRAKPEILIQDHYPNVVIKANNDQENIKNFDPRTQAYNKRRDYKLGVWRDYNKLSIYKWQNKHLIWWGL